MQEKHLVEHHSICITVCRIILYGLCKPNSFSNIIPDAISTDADAIPTHSRSNLAETLSTRSRSRDDANPTRRSRSIDDAEALSTRWMSQPQHQKAHSPLVASLCRHRPQSSPDCRKWP